MKRILIILLLLAACSTIDTSIKSGNEGFVEGNGSIGVIITHGLAASPHEVKPLADYLAKRNITVYAIRLDGHGTSVQDLATKHWEDWYRNYREAYLSMKPFKKKIFAAGMSAGGMIAMKLAEDEKIDGVIALAPALIMQDKRTAYAWLIKYFVPYTDRSIAEGNKPYYYTKYSVAAVAQMVEMGKIVKKNLAKIDEPILLMQYTNDTTVSTDSSRLAYEEVSSTEKNLTWINGTGHVFLYNSDADKYFEKIYEFIKANS